MWYMIQKWLFINTFKMSCLVHCISIRWKQLLTSSRDKFQGRRGREKEWLLGMSNDTRNIYFFQSKCAIFPSFFCLPLHGGCSFDRSLFLFFFGERKGKERGVREREREGRGRRARQCPSEKSINLARGLANVRTIRQRADWGGRGEWNSWEIEGGGKREGWGDTRSEPVSGERCSFVPHAIKPWRFYERGEPDDEVIYLPTRRERGMKRRREWIHAVTRYKALRSFR